MKIVWSIIGFVVAVLIYLGWRNVLAFRPTLFLFLLLLLFFFVSFSLWRFRKKLR